MAAIEILKPGRFTAMGGEQVSFEPADLEAAAKAYDPQLSEAPIVVGHPAHDAPAFGWIKGVTMEEGRLVAEPHQVDPAFAELVKAGRFKKVSASFYKPDAPNNPKPGSFYLRHVGFLGAQPPAVKGLKAVSLAGDEKSVVELVDGWNLASLASVMRSLRDWILARFGQEDADKAISGADVDFLLQSAGRDQAREMTAALAEAAHRTTETEIAVANDKAELDKKTAELAEREKSVADREAQAALAENDRFLEGLIAEGRVLPAQKAGLLAFMGALAADATVSLAEEGKTIETKAPAFFRGFLSKLPKQVDLAERSPSGKAPPADNAVALAEAIDAKVREAEKDGRTISYAEAAAQVTKAS